jgi:hypothetical protein
MKMLPGNGALLPLKSALSTGVKKWLPALFPFHLRRKPSFLVIQARLCGLSSRSLPAHVVYAFTESVEGRSK